MKTKASRPVLLKNYTPPPYLVDTVHLDVSLHPTETKIRARLAVRPNPAVAEPGPLRLDGEQMRLLEMALNGKRLAEAAYSVTPTALELPTPPDGPFRLEITTLVNPEANKALQGLYRSRGIYCTQCEAEGFRRITYFPDRPDVLARYTTRIEADIGEAGVLLANGNPTERGTLAGGKRHYAIWKDPHPKPSYLFALVGGNLTSIASNFTTLSGRVVDLRIYAAPGQEARCVWAMDALKRSMRWDEERFGREYDLDVFNIVAVSDFNMGAMENKGLNIFNDRLILASPDTATDAIYEAIESVVAHEYFHNWTGNRITCRDWFQLCLKEGLTVYRDQEFSADERNATVQRIADVRQLRSTQFPEDQGPLAHPVRPASYVEINNFYTATVYEKGAELVRMIETIIGRDAFRRGMDLYFERHDGEAATVEQFVACFEEASEKSLGQFFLWYTQAGTPLLTCKLEHDPKTKVLTLSVEQSQPEAPAQRNKPLHIPLRMGLIASTGEEVPLTAAAGSPIEGCVLHITKRAQTFRFRNIKERPVPSLLRQFSAPVRLQINLADRDLAFLMVNDTDPFNRWQASVDFALRTLVRMVRSRSEEAQAQRASVYAEALARAVEVAKQPADQHPAFLAELLKLPSEGDIARELQQNVDPSRVHDARKALLKQVGRALGPWLEARYQDCTDRGPFSPDPESAGRRALRGAALSLLAARGRRPDVARLSAHYWDAGNMTDQAHALYLIASRPGSERPRVLDDFYARWQHDHLVIDTWFAAQAIAPQTSTLPVLRSLVRHPLFSLTTPNKVRALIANFATLNPLQFTRPDGAGFRFVAEQVLALDALNPTIAARLVSAFRSWRSLEPKRRAAALAVLRDIADRDTLSRDVTEMVTRMLAPTDR